MKTPRKYLWRRAFLSAALIAPVVSLGTAADAVEHAGRYIGNSSQVASLNAIERENAKRGDGIWRLMSSGASPEQSIEGYASQVSVLAGDTLGFHVSTAPASRYRIDIHRLGWYEGQGARLLACLPSCKNDRQGVTQPAAPQPDPVTGFVDAGWRQTDELDVPSDWVTGTYIAEFVLTAGADAGRSTFYPFIVREPERSGARKPDILIQMPVSTWQAYNHWGGKSTYGFNSKGGDADVVSFNRPLHVPLRPHQDPDAQGPLDPGGPMAVFYWEYSTIRFLEREGYNVSYTTDVDVHRDPSVLTKYKMVMSIGHDEYWSMEQRNGFEEARAQGVNIAFIASNTAYWQVRYEDGDRTMVAYKESANNDPVQDQRKSTRFRDLPQPRPECQLMGVQYDPPIVATDGNHFPSYTVKDESLNHPWMQGTGFKTGDQLHNLVGYELDHIVSGCDVPGDLTTFFDFKAGSSPYLAPGGEGAQAVTYTAPSGAKVFSSGAMNFAWGLDNNNAPWSGSDVVPMPKLQQFMRNMINDMIDAEGSLAR